jgi:SAM-dependent methyltransferase
VSTDLDYLLEDLGDRRVLTVNGRSYTTHYSERVVSLLIKRKGARRAPLYLPFKETRAREFLAPLFGYLRDRSARGLSVLEVGCSFGHMTEYLAEQPEVASMVAFDSDPDFVEIVRTKVTELGLGKVREVALLDKDAKRLAWPDGSFDLVLVVGVIEHLPRRVRRVQVDEYYRVLASGGHIAILDTPNRLFPFETHSVRLPLVQWLPPQIAYRYARAWRRREFASVPYAEFVADGTGWQNATLRDCLPSSGGAGLVDVTEEAGYGWTFFQKTIRSRARRALSPILAACVSLLRATGQPPSLCLPYFNLLFRKVPLPASTSGRWSSESRHVTGSTRSGSPRG